MASVDKIQLFLASLAGNSDGSARVLEHHQKDLIAHIKATAVNAATTVAAKVQHSANGTDWHDLVSFTAIVGTAATEPKPITSAVLPYVRASVTLSGTTKAATVEIDLFFDK